MLSVGRQLGIQSKTVVCQQCAWEDLGNRLSARLVWLEWISGYLYVYCCPLCLSLDLAYKGKVLPFHPYTATNQEQPDTATSIPIAESRREQNQSKG
jgi:hypothetical protein